MMLSNNHVIANSNNAVFGDCICQPGPYDGDRVTAVPPTRLQSRRKFIPIAFGGQTMN